MPSAFAATRSAFSVTSSARASKAVTRSSMVVTEPLPYSLNEHMFPPGYDSYVAVIQARQLVETQGADRVFLGAR